MDTSLDELHSHKRQILRFLEHRCIERGLSPSFEEIHEAVKLASKDHVYRDLNMLEEKGFIGRDRRKSRSIRFLRCADGQPFRTDRFEVPPTQACHFGKLRMTRSAT